MILTRPEVVNSTAEDFCVAMCNPGVDTDVCLNSQFLSAGLSHSSAGGDKKSVHRLRFAILRETHPFWEELAGELSSSLRNHSLHRQARRRVQPYSLFDDCLKVRHLLRIAESKTLADLSIRNHRVDFGS